MIDIKATREEMKTLHAEASAFVEKYSTTDASAEEQTAQAARMAKLEKLQSNLDAAEKLARFAFTKEEKTPGVTAVVHQKTPDQIQAENYGRQQNAKPTREDYAKQLSAWSQGADREEYATLTATSNTALIPTIVGDPITPVKLNPYRLAYAKFGMTPVSLGNTANLNQPVLTCLSGGAVTEGQQNTPVADASPNAININLNVRPYQSGALWWSNMVVNAEQWDITTVSLPELQGAREYAVSAAISAAIIADGTISQSVTTATHNTLSIDNLDDLIHSFGLLWDQDKAIFLNLDAYNYAEKLKDSNGRPIFEAFTIQDQSFTAYKGVPVFKVDSLQAFTTAGNIVGVAISFRGFRLRDEQEKLIKYIDNPNYVDQTGLNNLRYQSFGYVPAAVSKLVAGT